MGGGGGGGDGGDSAETPTATAATTTTTTASRASGDDIVAGTPKAQQPALHVIVLGSGGGPLESNVTAFLVRSLASGWSKGSVVAVDAGVHLSAIANILENTQPPALGQTDDLCLPYTLTTGPFAGLEVPNATPAANAAHIHRSLIDTYLITHPHLDHISGFVVNTAGLPGSRPKRLAGLPSTIAAFKAHIFNNVIWPNLSDENNGAGLVTYMRLVEGGSPALGEGEGRGYLEICDGLAVKIWGVSHGHCIERHSHRGSGSSVRHGSFDASTMGPIGVGMGLSGNPPLLSPRALAHHNSANTSLGSLLQQQQQQQQQQLQQQQREQDRMQGGGGSQAGAAAIAGGRSGSISGAPGESVCVYDSSAYFIRDVATGREVLIFGDVEPDSISLSPRNQQIWQEAAPKIAAGKLAAIFIECSYDDSQSVDRLFGHLTPRFIAEEMSVLAVEVTTARLAMQQERHVSASTGYGSDKKKRKRDSADDRLLSSRRKAATPTPHGVMNATPSRSNTTSYPVHLTAKAPSRSEDPVSPKTVKPPTYVPTTRMSVSGINTSSSINHPPSSFPDDSISSSENTNIIGISTGGGGAMASVMSKGRSGSGSGSGCGSYFIDSPHLTTPTAELSLQDLGDMANTAAAVPRSLNNSGILPPPVLHTGVYLEEPQSIAGVDGSRENLQNSAHQNGSDGSGGGSGDSYAVGPLDHVQQSHGTGFNRSADNDVSMGIAPDDVDTEDTPTPTQQRNGNQHHHHCHHHHQHNNYHNTHLRAHGDEGVFDVHNKEEEKMKIDEETGGGDRETQQHEDKAATQTHTHTHTRLPPLPLKGLKVVIIHVKDKLNDGPKTGDVILEELVAHERELQLGCEFLVSKAGQDLYL